MEHRCLSPWKGAFVGMAVMLIFETAAAVLPGGPGASPAVLLRGLPLLAVASFYWTWILGKIPGLTLRDAALYGSFFGLCAASLGPLADWAWGVMPLAFALKRASASVAGWTLASMALSRCYAAACALPR